jgi:APA family basic amino acid/polyamine antiporter
MSAAIVLAVPYPEIDAAAPFAAAFQARGMAWAARAVSVGALAGIVTSTMSGLLSQSRLLLVLGRERLLPAWLARVAAGSGAPVNATLVTGAAAGLMALTVEIQLLAEMVSAGTLYVFWAVTCGVVFRRCHRAGEPGGARVLRRLGALTAASAALSLSYTYGAPWAAVAGAGAGWAGAAAAVAAMPTVWAPEKFAVPLFPATPVLGVLFTIHLLCSLGWPAYVRFAVWMAAGAAVYGLYGARSAQAEEDLAEARFRAQLDGSEDGENGGGGGEVELLQRAPLRALGPERPVPSGAGDGDGAALLPRDGAASSRV